jgi:hypothetical protein
MAPHHGADMGVRFDDAPKRFGFGETHGVQPAAAHEDRVMVQAHHGVFGRTGQRGVEPRKFGWAKAAADVPGIVTVEHDELPAVHFMRAANLKRCAAEFLAHGLGLVVIARNAQHRFLQGAEEAAKAQITGAVVLHQIAGDQHRRVIGHARERVVEHRTQTRIGFYAAQPAAGAAVKMWIRDL